MYLIICKTSSPPSDTRKMGVSYIFMQIRGSYSMQVNKVAFQELPHMFRFSS